MASVYDLKPRFQALLLPLVGGLRRMGVTPNAITIAALIGSFIAGWLTLRAVDNPRWLLVIPVWLFVRMALNALDGMMAREHGLASSLGAALNELGDVVSDVALYLPLAWVHPASELTVVGFVVGAIVTEFAGVLAQALAGTRTYHGPMGKSDRAFWVGALAVATAWFPSVFQWWPWLFALAGAATIPTVISRLRSAIRGDA